MSEKTKQIAEMIEMLPEQEQNLACEMLKRIILAWDPDFIRVTPQERKRLEEAEQSGFVAESEIDWNNLSAYA